VVLTHPSHNFTTADRFAKGAEKTVLGEIIEYFSSTGPIKRLAWFFSSFKTY
jgi:hypothetical protein